VGKVTPEMITAVITGGIGAFTGLSRALSSFNNKLERRFERLEDDFDDLQDRVTANYVLKEDFLREMESVHSKLDRILDHLISN
jgi:flagellar capping protein FliD|tara:strand:- start:577 stop:828 length:252 start_codon:yes stop_codon:yes gene_type:complete